MLRCGLVHVGVRLQLEQKVDDVDEKEDLTPVRRIIYREAAAELTTLVPRLILRDWASASFVSLKEAWKAV